MPLCIVYTASLEFCYNVKFIDLCMICIQLSCDSDVAIMCNEYLVYKMAHEHIAGMTSFLYFNTM